MVAALLRRPWVHLVLALLTGAASVPAYSHSSLFPLAILTAAALVWLWRCQVARPFAVGYAFGLGLFLTGGSWVYISMHDIGGMSWWLAGLATLLLGLWAGVFPALGGWLQHKGCQGQRPLTCVCVVAAAWTASEMGRAWLVFLSSGLALGYSQLPPSPLAGFAPLLGIHGVSFITMMVAAALIWLWRSPGKMVTIVIITVALGAIMRQVPWTRPQGAPLAVSLLQGNIPQTLRWTDEGVRKAMHTYLQLARDNPAALVVLPEAAIPLEWSALPQDYVRALDIGAGGAVILGTITRDVAGNYYNSALTLDGQQRYHKTHLMPFGEYIPAGFAWFLAQMNIPMSNLAAGADHQPPMVINQVPIQVNICYEDIFGDELAWSLVHQMPRPALLLNLTNTAWFGRSLAQGQHLQMARMRTLELGRPMLTATNTGVTSVIDERAQVLSRLPEFTEGAVQIRVQGRTGTTPFIWWRHWAVCILCGTVGLWVLWHRRKSVAAGRDLA